MKNYFWPRILIVGILVAIAFGSFSIVAEKASDPGSYADTIASLDQKKSVVMELTAAATGAGAAITMLPGDTCTPIAEKLIDMSSYFLIVTCALYLEKYLLTITGWVVFKFLVPVLCLIASYNLFRRKRELNELMVKMLLFSMAVTLVVPMSVKVSDMIEDQYKQSIETTINSAKDFATEESAVPESQKQESEPEKKGFLSGLIDKVQTGVTETTQKATAQVEAYLNRMIEALAVMIVTSCVIPIVVILFFIWLIKVVLSVDIGNKMKSYVQNE